MDAGLNFFYVIMGVIGWVNWSRGGEGDLLPISALSRRSNIAIVISGGIGTILMGYLLFKYTDASLPYWDALTTIFSVIATFLLIRRQIDNWVYWIITDAIYVGMYYYREAYLFAILFIVYTLMAVSGYIEWKKEKALM
jgi:nicotinamide mononucleotide transporter